MKKPAKSLPSRPNLEYLRTEAKTLLDDLRSGKAAAARAFVDYLPAAKSMSSKAVLAAGFRLADAQSVIARKSGFQNWPGLARHVQDLRALEGQWAFTSLKIDGTDMPALSLAGTELLIDGDLFRMESPEATYEGVFNIDADTDPTHIDIEFVEGPEAGEWSYGIYVLDRDELTMCLGLTGSPRPTRFAADSGSGHALERLHRMSAARPSNVTGGKRGTRARPENATAPAVDPSTFTQPMTPLLGQLQGEWRPLSLVSNGTPLQSAYLAYGSRTQTGNETKVVFGGQTMVHALMRLDESVSPVAIDYLNIGKGSPVMSLGILDFVDGEMRVCMAKPGDSRPGDFTCDAGSGRTLSVWKPK